MMKNATAVILAAALFAGTATVASADSGPGHHRHACDHGNRIERMQKALGLTDQQVSKLTAIRDKFRPKQEKLRGEMRKGFMAMHTLTDKGNASEASIRKLADAQGRLVSDMIVLRVTKQEEMSKVLTAQQREKAKELRAQWHRHWGQGHGPYPMH